MHEKGGEGEGLGEGEEAIAERFEGREGPRRRGKEGTERGGGQRASKSRGG